MKFNVVFGLAAALALAPNAVALNLFGDQQHATPTTGAQPSGTVPSGLPHGSGSGSEGGFDGGAQESGRPQASGTVPSGVAGGAQPSGTFGQGGQGGFPSGGAQPTGGFGHGGHHGAHGGQGGQGGFPSGGAQPSGSFGGPGQGGEGGTAPTAVPSGAAPSGSFGGSSGQESGFITVSGPLPTGSTVPEAGSSSEGTQSFERVHARQIRPF